MPTKLASQAGGSLQPAGKVTFQRRAARPAGEADPTFTLRAPSDAVLARILASDTYSAAMAFIRGEFDVDGDLCAAIRFKGWEPRARLRAQVLAVIARCATALQCIFQNKAQSVRHIRFHYDRPNGFYRLFLDSRMVYSCAYFRTPEATLEEAQLAKLDHICLKLDLTRGERFLDLGCGWGALAKHAAAGYGVRATGCTNSRAQFEFASRHADGQVRILEQDYRDLSGCFDKISSVGMFEHVGRRRAPQYFRKVATLLAPGGLFLNHTIARPQGAGDDAASLFVRRQIFPGGELMHLQEIVGAAEEAGFEVLDVENLRPHYARTCRWWEQTLAANHEPARRFVDERTYRAWRLWLAASAVSFEDGFTSIYQILLSRRGSHSRRLTRDYMYASAR